MTEEADGQIGRTGRDRSYHHGNLVAALIDATIDIVREKGIEQVSVREAARRAGVSPGAPFRHFENKAALMLAIAEQAISLLDAAFEEALSATETLPAIDRIEARGHAYIEWAYQYPIHLQILWTPFVIDASGSQYIADRSIKMIESSSALFEQAQREGDIVADLDIELVAFAARTQLYGLARMFTDGDFYTAGLKADPLGGMKRAFSHHIGQLRTRA
jgi:AcrR family transcriptional regulator